MSSFHIQLMDDLCQFIRRAKHPATSQIPSDVETAIAAIGYRPARHIAAEKKMDWRLNLKNAKLTGAVLAGADLSHAVLDHAYLSGAVLDRSDFSEALLAGAHLAKAKLDYADLSGAELAAADLSRADLEGADLSRADLAGANLKGAILTDADLSHAEGLTQAQLDKATAKPGQLPNLVGVLDAKTGKPLVWRNGKNGKAKP